MKLRKLEECGPHFEGIFELMFSERENIFYEKSEGYRIRKITYGESRDRILRRAEMLEKLLSDVPKDAVIGIYMDNNLTWLELFWTVLCAGYSPLLMNLRLDDAALEQAIRSADVKAVLSNGKTFSVRTISPDQVAGSEGTPEKKIESGSFGTVFYVMSSGTSSHVKICGYTAAELFSLIKDSADIVRNCRRIKMHCNGELKLLTFLPFYHIFGLVAVYMWFAFFSRTFVELGDMSPRTLLTTIKRHKVTHIFAVPLFWDTVYEQAVRTIGERGEKTSARFEKGLRLSVKLGGTGFGRIFRKLAMKEVRDGLFGESIAFMITGGGHIRREVLEFFNGIGYHLANGYGMTEIGISSVEQSEDLKTLCSGSVGRPMTSMEYKVDESGELIVRGTAMSRFIITDGEKTENTGWFHTHDLAEEKNGRYYILGRQDDLMVGASGENLNPNLYEERLRLPNVKNVCLIDAAQGKRALAEEGTEPSVSAEPVLLVSLNRYLAKETLQALDAALKEKLREMNLAAEVRGIVYVSDELIQGEEFKLNRARLAKDYAAGRLHTLDPETGNAPEEHDALLERIRALYAEALGKEIGEIGYTEDFFLDAGGTSLDYFAMVSELQKEFGVVFPVQEGKSLNTLKEIYEFVRNEGNGGPVR